MSIRNSFRIQRLKQVASEKVCVGEPLYKHSLVLIKKKKVKEHNTHRSKIKKLRNNRKMEL